MRYLHTIIFILFIIVGSAQAEVMDKESSLTINIYWGLISSILCLLTARFTPWFLLIIVPFPIFYFYALVIEILDPFVGKAILKETGNIYIYSSYGLPVLITANIIIGFLWRLKNKKSTIKKT